MMRRWFACLLTVCMLLVNVSVAAADNHTVAEETEVAVEISAAAEAAVDVTALEGLPAVTVTPDSPLYVIKLLIERLRVALTIDAAARAYLLAELAETRLAEAKAMLAEGKAELAARAIAESQLKLGEARAVLVKAARDGKELTAIERKLTAEVEADTAPAHWPPRIQLVLGVMAEASGRTLAEVAELHAAGKGLGEIARELGVHLGEAQRTAQAEWKQLKAERKAEAKAVKRAGAKMELKGEAAAEAKAGRKAAAEADGKGRKSGLLDALAVLHGGQSEASGETEDAADQEAEDAAEAEGDSSADAGARVEAGARVKGKLKADGKAENEAKVKAKGGLKLGIRLGGN